MSIVMAVVGLLGGGFFYWAAEWVRSDRERRRAQGSVDRTGIEEPPVSIITDARSAGHAAEIHMKWLGYHDASAPAVGPNAGVHVGSRTAIAQVRDHGEPIGFDDVERHFDVAAAESRVGLFYCRGGYTDEALDFGDRAAMPFFRYAESAQWVPANDAARSLYAERVGSERRRSKRPARPKRPVPTPVPVSREVKAAGGRLGGGIPFHEMQMRVRKRKVEWRR